MPTPTTARTRSKAQAKDRVSVFTQGRGASAGLSEDEAANGNQCRECKPDEGGEHDGAGGEQDRVALGRVASVADGLPESGERLTADQAGAVVGAVGASEKEPGEEDEEEERDGDGGEQPACVNIDGADLLPKGSERGHRVTSSEQERCTATTPAKRGWRRSSSMRRWASSLRSGEAALVWLSR